MKPVNPATLVVTILPLLIFSDCGRDMNAPRGGTSPAPAVRGIDLAGIDRSVHVW